MMFPNTVMEKLFSNSAFAPILGERTNSMFELVILYAMIGSPAKSLRVRKSLSNSL